MKYSDRLNHLVHPFFAWRLREHYRREMRGWEKRHPESFGEVSAELRKKYIDLWSKLIPNPYDGWLRLLTRLSGKMDHRFMPADAYYSVIERCLNDCNAASTGIDDKNLMSLYAPAELLPGVVLRYVRGTFLDADFKAMPIAQANELLRVYPSDVVGKAASDTSGGHSVQLFRKGAGGLKRHGETVLSAEWIAAAFSTYIVQERVVQEPIVSAFNPSSVNTCRIVTFRRPWSGQVSAMCSMLRLGCGTEIVDNISSGGCCVDVAEDGRLASTGVTPDFGRISEHSGSHIKFEGKAVPYFREMCEAVCRVATRVPDFNIMGFDMIAREDGRPCIIEVNTTSIASVMIQMGHPLFGEGTDEVVEWCIRHRQFDCFKHFRTFY
jgi:hypothetical protein